MGGGLNSSRCPTTIAFITGFGNIPDFFEDLNAETLVVGVITGEMTVILELCVGAGATEDEFFPVAHVGLYLYFFWGGGGEGGV